MISVIFEISYNLLHQLTLLEFSFSISEMCKICQWGILSSVHID